MELAEPSITTAYAQCVQRGATAHHRRPVLPRPRQALDAGHPAPDRRSVARISRHELSRHADAGDRRVDPRTARTSACRAVSKTTSTATSAVDAAITPLRVLGERQGEGSARCACRRSRSPRPSSRTARGRRSKSISIARGRCIGCALGWTEDRTATPPSSSRGCGRLHAFVDQSRGERFGLIGFAVHDERRVLSDSAGVRKRSSSSPSACALRPWIVRTWHRTSYQRSKMLHALLRRPAAAGPACCGGIQPTKTTMSFGFSTLCFR